MRDDEMRVKAHFDEMLIDEMPRQDLECLSKRRLERRSAEEQTYAREIFDIYAREIFDIAAAAAPLPRSPVRRPSRLHPLVQLDEQLRDES